VATLGPGCDSKQPTDASGGNGNATVTFSAQADVQVYDVYDFFVDQNHCADTCTGDVDCTQSTLHQVPRRRVVLGQKDACHAALPSRTDYFRTTRPTNGSSRSRCARSMP